MGETGIEVYAPRVDGREKVMGQPLYGADRLPVRTVFATPVAAAVGKARALEIEIGRASCRERV